MAIICNTLKKASVLEKNWHYLLWNYLKNQVHVNKPKTVD